MTNSTAPPAAPDTYDYVGGTPELDQLLAMEQEIYDQQKALEKRLDEVKARIKVALTSVTRPVLDPETGQMVQAPYPAYRIAVPGQIARALKWTTSRRLDTPMLRAAHPEIYDAFTKESGAWKLERVK